MTHSRLLSVLSLCCVFAACTPATPGTSNSASSSSSTAVVENGGEVSIVWQVSTVTDTQDVPHSTIGVRVAGAFDHSIDLGEYALADQGNVEIPGALSGRSFWYAGGGYRFAVFQEGQTLIVKKQALEETSEVDLPWEEAGRMDLPAGVTVHMPKAMESSSTTNTDAMPLSL